MAATLSSDSPSVASSRFRALVQSALLDPNSRSYQVTIRVIVTFIFLSVATIVFETVDDVYRPLSMLIDGLEILILAVFTAEYAANIYAAEDKKKYLTSFWGLVDLLAIVPSYLSLLHLAELKAFRTLRVFRVLRVLKLMKLATARAQESSARAEQKRNTFSLDIQIYFIALFTVVVISSTLAYYAEYDVSAMHEELKRTAFTNIPQSMWWAIVTITTTGYGDMVPLTLWGRLVAAATMLSGLALFGILTSVIGRAVLVSLFGAAPEEHEGGAPPDDGDSPPAGPGAGSPVARTAGLRAQVGSAPLVRPITSRGMVAATAASLRTPVAAAGAPVVRLANPSQFRRRSSAAYMRSEINAREVHPQANLLYRLTYAAFVDQSSPLFHVVSIVVIVLVFASVGLVILESVQSIFTEYEPLFHIAEYVIVVAFTVEYLGYLAVAQNKRAYVFSFWGIVDLLAILPTYLSLLNFTGVKVVRTLRILRVLRILKLSKLAAQRTQESVRQRENTFWIDLQIYLITLLTAVTISSTLVYYAERDQPNTLFTSIPAAMWWAVVTITTTGYGDMAPETVAGRIMAGATMLTGLALFGILTSVIGRAMMSSLFGRTDDAD